MQGWSGGFAGDVPTIKGDIQMKQGTTFEELVARVEQEAQARQDYYVPGSELRLVSNAIGSRLETTEGLFHVRDTAHTHLAGLCGIERRYYQKLREHSPVLLDENANFWLSRSNKTRIIRALDRDARAIVSPRYATLDNDALLRTVEPIIAELDATVESADISDERLIIKVASPRLQGDVKVGDAVQVGIVIQNSEVRAGVIAVDLFVKRLVCANGLIIAGKSGSGAHRRHVGRIWHSGDESGLVPENMGRIEWERLVWQGIQDDIRQAVSRDAFGGLLERLRDTTRMQTSLEPDVVVKRLGDAYKLHESLQGQVSAHLVADEYTGSLWDVVNAVTRTAEDVTDYARATDLEKLGGQLAHLSPREWQRLVSLN
jgi:hypothetical protein